MKKLLILVGSQNQVPLIERAHELGYYVVLCDNRDNVPGIRHADIHYRVDALDVDAVVNVGKKEKVSGIVTNSEPAFLAMSEVADRLGLRGTPLTVTKLFKNKFLMRQFCQSHGIPTPAFKLCGNAEDAIAFYRDLGKKCIIKPLDNSASRGVFSINNETDILTHFGQSMEAASKLNPYVIIEEYVTGTEFTVDGLMTPDGHKCLAISEKKHYAYNENVACELLFENHSERFDYALLRQTNDNLVNLSGMTFGLTHAEYKFSGGIFYLIEIQARGGGNFIATDIVPFISGIDSYKEQIKWAVGDWTNVRYDYGDISKACAVLHFFDVPGKGGTVVSIDGTDYFASLGEKMMYELEFKVGDKIEQTKDDSTRIGWYILKCGNKVELRKLMQGVDKNFKITVN